MTPWPAHLAASAALVLSLTAVAACAGQSDDGDEGAQVTSTAVPTPVVPSPSLPATTQEPEETDSDEAAATTVPPGPEPEPEARLDAYGVSAGHELAAQAGARILEQGGNAVDAAIAAAFADSVIQPVTSGIGGGGAAVVLTDDAADSYDYREVVGADGTIPADEVGIPGFVAGMGRLHQDHGSLPWADLLQPAVQLAEDGGPVSGFLAMTLAIPKGDTVTAGLGHFRRTDGGPLREGDLLVQQDLARTLTVLAEEGPESLYTGSLADRLLQAPGIDAQSLSDYQVQRTAPPSGEVGDYTMLSAAPALPGAALIQLVQVAEFGGIDAVDPYSPDFAHLQTLAWGVAEESVHTVFGDPAFVDVPVERLTDPDRNAALADDLLASGQAPSTATGVGYESGGNTTHISVVDTEGWAVSMTNTITHYWGSGRYVDGYFLNDHLGRFEVMGTTDANVAAPGRRSVSWSAPSMLLDDSGRPVLVLGTPGGHQIPNTIAAAVLRWALHDEELADVVSAPRFIHVGGELVLETAELAAGMEGMGYTVRVVEPSLRSDFGSIQALEVDWDEGTVSSFADDRRSAGFSLGRPDQR